MYKPVYVDIGYRCYELVIVAGPLIHDGEETWCRILHGEQRIELSEWAPVDERLGIVALAVSQCWKKTEGRAWRMIPLIDLPA